MTSQDELTLSLPHINAFSTLEKTILAGIVFILALPLLGDYGMWLFPIGRDVIFKLAVEFLIVLALVFLSLKNLGLFKNLKLKIKNFRNPIALSILLFWLVTILSTLNSVQMDFSIWGNIYKNQGLMTWTHYILFFFLLIGFLKNKKHWRFFLQAAIVVGTLVSLIALWQVLQSGFDSRAVSTLNNSNYLAGYLVLLLPMTFAFFLRNKSILLGSAAVLQFLTLLATQTRGGYLGIAAAIFIFAILYFVSIKKLPKKKICMMIVAPTALLVTTYYSLLATDLGQSFQQKLPNFTDRFLNGQSIISDSSPRLEAWRAGWQGMLKRPIWGYGPENFFVAFDEHYNGSQDYAGSLAQEGSLWESWFDKAHNFIFDIGATTGFLGLFAYTAIFVSAIWVLLRKLQTTTIGLIVALVGYLVQNLLGFDTLVPGIYLMFLLGYSYFLTSGTQNTDFTKHKQNTSPQKPKTQTFVLSALSFICALCGLGFVFSFKTHMDMLGANHELNLAESLAQRSKIAEAFTAFEKGLEYNAAPVNPNLRRRYAVIALAYYDAVKKRCESNMLEPDPAVAGSGSDSLSRDRCKQLFTDSKKYLTRALELQNENAAAEWPRFTRNYIYAAQISHILGDYENSDLYFKKALELSPRRNSIYIEWNRLRKERQNDKG